jgi:hypothetical protein
MGRWLGALTEEFRKAGRGIGEWLLASGATAPTCQLCGKPIQPSEEAYIGKMGKAGRSEYVRLCWAHVTCEREYWKAFEGEA